MSDNPLDDLVKWLDEYRPKNPLLLLAYSGARVLVRRVSRFFHWMNARYG